MVASTENRGKGVLPLNPYPPTVVKGIRSEDPKGVVRDWPWCRAQRRTHGINRRCELGPTRVADRHRDHFGDPFRVESRKES